MAAPRKYTFDKLPMAMSYKKYLETELAKMELRGVKVKLKEYKARVPNKLLKMYEMTNKMLKDLDSVIVVLESGGKIIAHTILTNQFYFNTIKVSDRDGTDDMMLSCLANFITPLENQLDG